MLATIGSIENDVPDEEIFMMCDFHAEIAEFITICGIRSSVELVRMRTSSTLMEAVAH